MKKSLTYAMLLLAGGSAWAGDALTDAMQEAYAPYRAALFRTNSNAQAESQQAMAQAQQSWGKLSAQFAAKRPAPYDRDTAFASSLAEVSKVYATAAEQVAAKQLPAAHETLEKARDVMAELRRRNNVIVFSDYMNAYHAEMEHVLNESPKLLAQDKGMQQLLAMTGALEYLSKKLSTEAPAAYLKNEEFVALNKAVSQSVADLLAALYSQDASAVKSAIAKVKAPYSKLFLKFG